MSASGSTSSGNSSDLALPNDTGWLSKAGTVSLGDFPGAEIFTEHKIELTFWGIYGYLVFGWYIFGSPKIWSQRQKTFLKGLASETG